MTTESALVSEARWYKPKMHRAPWRGFPSCPADVQEVYPEMAVTARTAHPCRTLSCVFSKPGPGRWNHNKLTIAEHQPTTMEEICRYSTILHLLQHFKVLTSAPSILLHSGPSHARRSAPFQVPILAASSILCLVRRSF